MLLGFGLGLDFQSANRVRARITVKVRVRPLGCPPACRACHHPQRSTSPEEGGMTAGMHGEGRHQEDGHAGGGSSGEVVMRGGI